MKFNSEPLWNFLEFHRASGADVRVFPSNKRDASGNARFVLRLVDPDEPETGGGFLASFSQTTLKEEATCEFVGDKPTRKAVQRSEAWDETLSDAKKCVKYLACHCIIEESDVDDVTFTKDRVDTEFISITTTKGATSISGVTDVADAVDSGASAKSVSGKGKKVK